MNKRPAPWPLLVAIVLCAAGGLFAQAPPNIDDLLSKRALSAAEREQIAQWLSYSLDEIKTASKTGDRDRASGTVREILAKTRRATPEFQDVLAELAAEQVGAMLTNGDPALSRRLADLLRQLDNANTIDGLFAALRSSDVQTRYVAATGIRSFAGRIDLTAARVLNELEQAANAEPHPLVRQRMLEAMLLPKRLQESLTALDNSLMKSLTRIAEEPPSELSPETRILELLADPATGVKDADQRSRAELVAALAAVLAQTVERYASGADSGSDRLAVEVLILYAESAVTAAVRDEAGAKLPSVTAAMMRGGASTIADMRAELVKWVGDKSANTKGLLNAAPWNAPVGGLPEEKKSS